MKHDGQGFIDVVGVLAALFIVLSVFGKTEAPSPLKKQPVKAVTCA